MRPTGASLAVCGLLGLSSAACLVGPNPDFVANSGPTASQGESSGDATDTGCDGGCEFLGQSLTCADGVCFGVVELDVLGDTFVRESDPDTNFGADEILHVEFDDVVQRSLIGLEPLATLDDELIARGATLHELTLHLDFKSGDMGRLSVYRVEQPWSQDAVTWTEAPALTPAALLVDWQVIDGGNTLDLLELPVSWNTELDHGIALLSTAEDDPQVPGGHVELFSCESASGPRLDALVSW